MIHSMTVPDGIKHFSKGILAVLCMGLWSSVVATFAQAQQAQQTEMSIQVVGDDTNGHNAVAEQIKLVKKGNSLFLRWLVLIKPLF
jgi:hypothetical protein